MAQLGTRTVYPQALGKAAFVDDFWMAELHQLAADESYQRVPRLLSKLVMQEKKTASLSLCKG